MIPDEIEIDAAVAQASQLPTLTTPDGTIFETLRLAGFTTGVPSAKQQRLSAK